MQAATVEPGDILELTRPFDGLSPGRYLVLLVHAGRASLAAIRGFPINEIDVQMSLPQPSLRDLDVFRRTAIRIPMCDM